MKSIWPPQTTIFSMSFFIDQRSWPHCPLNPLFTLQEEHSLLTGLQTVLWWLVVCEFFLQAQSEFSVQSTAKKLSKTKILNYLWISQK